MRLYYLVDAIPTDAEEGITADIPSGMVARGGPFDPDDPLAMWRIGGV